MACIYVELKKSQGWGKKLQEQVGQAIGEEG